MKSVGTGCRFWIFYRAYHDGDAFLVRTQAGLNCINSSGRMACMTVTMLLQFGHAQHFEHELHQEGHHEATEGH